MNKIPVLWLYSRGFGDQGLLMHLFRGDLWNTPIEFDEYIVTPDSQLGDYIKSEGAILIIPGGYAASKGQESTDFVKSLLQRYFWTIIIHTSDEEMAFNSEQFRSGNVKTWMQMYNPTKHQDCDRKILYSWWDNTLETLKNIPRKPLNERKLWGFAGQVTHKTRRELVQELSIRPKGEGILYSTEGFAQGLPQEEYLKLLTDVAIAPCPSGPLHPESFRCFEALETGCLPVVQKRAEQWNSEYNYWRYLNIDSIIIPQVDSWDEVHDILDFYKNNPVKLQQAANLAGSWWLNYKRNLVNNLICDINQLK
jgi:hypothetical protein